MPRKPRVQIAGYYYIVNRGIKKETVFKDDQDYQYFEKLLYNCTTMYNVILHSYCLMSNHYHLLLEIQQNDQSISKCMRCLNSAYAIKFNKKYKRSGHLWQGRFKSWYITNKIYLYTLIRHIEQNPLKTNIVKSLKNYPYSSYHYFLDHKNTPSALQKSWIVKNFQTDVETIKQFIETPVDLNILQELKKASNFIIKPKTEKKLDIKYLKKLLKNTKNKKERNKQINQAYKSGYSQYMIAKVLNLSQPTINKIIKREIHGKN